MLRITDIQSAMAHLVGWEQASGSTQRIQESLTESESGLTYQQVHDMLTLDNIRAVLPKESAPDAWDSTKTYRKGETCTYNETAFIAVQDNTNQQPGTDFSGDYNEDYGDGYWRPYDQMSEFLRKQTADGVARMANRLVTEKSLNGASKQLFERKTIFDVPGRIANRVPLTHSLVGYKITPLRGTGVTAQIHRIGLQMTGATGKVKLYLFHSSRSTPLRTIEIRILDAKGYQWQSVDDLYLPYTGSENRNDGGSWFLLYNEDALPSGMQAVNLGRDWSSAPTCGGCNKGDIELWNRLMRYAKIMPARFPIPTNFESNPSLPDLSTLVTPSSTSYGLNLDMSIGCDISYFLTSQRAICASALQKEVAVSVLRRILHNPSVNVNRNQMNAALQMDLEGSTMLKSNGIVKDLDKAYKALDLDTQGMDSACLACRKNGIRLKMC